MEKICGIYCIENLINGKRYVGQSIDIYSRWKNHIHSLNGNRSNNTLLQRAWNKYGEDNFKFQILEACAEEDLDEKERAYINLYNSCENGYNIEDGGNEHKHLSYATKNKLRNAHMGIKCSPETREKMSKSRIGPLNPMYGKRHTEETKQIISEKNKGRTGHPQSEYQRNAARDANLGKTVSDVTKNKISEANKGKIPHNKDLNQVYCVELNKCFNNASEAGKELNIRGENILGCCRHYKGRNTCGGYHWKFADEV